MSQEPISKVIILGMSGAGKTSLMRRFTQDYFDRTYMTITIDFAVKRVTLSDGSSVKVQVWDTAGQERFKVPLSPVYFRGLAACLLVFDLSDRTSFEDVALWMDMLEKQCSDNVVKALVGAKSDLEPQVTREEAEDYAAKCCCSYFETSSKLGTGVQEAFEKTVEEAASKRKDTPATQSMVLNQQRPRDPQLDCKAC